jgi:hypothetical protein
MKKKNLFWLIFIIAIVLILVYVLYPTQKVVCASEGEEFSMVYDEYPDVCCNGLTAWDAGFDTRISIDDECYSTGLVAGNPIGVCINCGNDICEDLENPCNCPEDCVGEEKSDYSNVEEFCADEYDNYCDEVFTGEGSNEELCGLC